MTERKNRSKNGQVVAKARRVLAFAQRRVRDGDNWVDMSNALFGVGGKATQSFPTEAERTAFCKTNEYKRVLALLDRLPAPPARELVELAASANGAISVRLPRSV